ncbi:MAG: cation diffusion facilitator family transporter [Proteobacteria bacterium]|nr:cation diffusion facilitator family transporter [Pseudomonadota bacterium]
MSAPLPSRDRLRAGLVSLGIGSLVFGGKFAAYWITDSAAILADALESSVNLAAAGLLLFALVVAARPADRDHPYGHGKVEAFSAGIEGTLVAVAAVVIAVEAVDAWLHGTAPRQLDAGLALVLGASVANAGLGVYLVRVGRRTQSQALEADGHHVLADVWTSAAVVAGLGAVHFTGIAWLDPAIALGVAGHVLWVGVRLVRGAVGALMDAADDALLDKFAAVLERHRRPQWIDAHGLRAWRSGAAFHADFHLVVPRYWNAEQLHAEHLFLEGQLLDAAETTGDLVVHFDPCEPQHCGACAMPECPVRSRAQERTLDLHRARVTRAAAPHDHS